METQTVFIFLNLHSSCMPTGLKLFVFIIVSLSLLFTLMFLTTRLILHV